MDKQSIIESVERNIELVISQTYSSGSTDMGDLSTFMPVVHPYAAGQSGTSHGGDYKIADKDAALITNAKWQLMMINLLLGNSAKRAKRIVADFKGGSLVKRSSSNIRTALTARARELNILTRVPR